MHKAPLYPFVFRLLLHCYNCHLQTNTRTFHAHKHCTVHTTLHIKYTLQYSQYYTPQYTLHYTVHSSLHSTHSIRYTAAYPVHTTHYRGHVMATSHLYSPVLTCVAGLPGESAAASASLPSPAPSTVYDLAPTPLSTSSSPIGPPPSHNHLPDKSMLLLQSQVRTSSHTGILPISSISLLHVCFIYFSCTTIVPNQFGFSLNIIIPCVRLLHCCDVGGIIVLYVGVYQFLTWLSMRGTCTGKPPVVHLGQAGNCLCCLLSSGNPLHGGQHEMFTTQLLRWTVLTVFVKL